MNKRAILLSMIVSTLSCVPLIANPSPIDGQIAQVKDELKWQDFYCTSGQCTLKFPSAPEHISEKMSVPEEGYELKYDAYIASEDKKSVYMLLVAQYPEFVDQSLAQASLEGFLNGVLANNPGGQLLFADMLLVEGKPALDFFIRTGGVYFKGRAIMVQNQLYLMAMECEVQNYDEGGYKLFVSSFKFKQ